MRCVPLLLKHYEKEDAVPQLMALGFAAYILFMSCTEQEGKYIGSAGGKQYIIQDDHAEWFADNKTLQDAQLVDAVLSDTKFWKNDLTMLPGFKEAVSDKYKQLTRGEVKLAIEESKIQPELSTRRSS